MQEIILASGNKLQIQSPAFKDGKYLLKCFARELKTIGLDVNNLSSEELALSKIFDGALSLISSEEFENAFWVCANTCLYNGERVNEKLFDDREEAREDFFEIEYKIVEACLKPFLKRLPTLLKSSITKIVR